jgi:UDP-2-acetamido-2,6-beta-L-arabino-hexul-4-ose reductase
MSHVSLTGFDGFLGWHTRCAALASGLETQGFEVGERFGEGAATRAIDGSSRYLHIAGVNRGSDDEVLEGNLLFARQAVAAIEAASTPPPVIVYANSTQVGNGSVYARAKEEAGAILAEAASGVGATFVDIKFPNLFGEHGRPFYNSVVSTFCHLLAKGDAPSIDQDKELTLLHAQDAADVMLGAAKPGEVPEARLTVRELLAKLETMSTTYATGEIPSLATGFDRDLFNTYRSFVFASRPEIRLAPWSDGRGSLVEVVRSHGGPGQFSYSSTVAGASRADHFHRRKVERVSAVRGTGLLTVRRLFSEESVEIRITGDAPVAIDVPTMWTHRVENVGSEDLLLVFWANRIFDPSIPDVYPDQV